jgi:hypothetical protein
VETDQVVFVIKGVLMKISRVLFGVLLIVFGYVLKWNVLFRSFRQHEALFFYDFLDLLVQGNDVVRFELAIEPPLV